MKYIWVRGDVMNGSQKGLFEKNPGVCLEKIHDEPHSE
jgi:hypothetical protein